MAMTDAERQANKRARDLKVDLVRVETKVYKWQKAQLLEFAKELRDGHRKTKGH